jgi:hypothetical protein
MAKSGTARTRTISPAAGAQDGAAVDRRARLLAFLADPPPEILAAAEAVGRAFEHYGDDTDRELADIAAGRHPLQAKTASR